MILFTIDGNDYTYTDKLRFTEAVIVQRILGRTVAQFEAGLKEGDAECIGALAWITMRRTENDPGPWKTFDFEMSELHITEVDEDGNIVLRDHTGAVIAPDAPEDDLTPLDVPSE